MSARPNILMMTCHDLGQHLGCYGVETVHSGSIDRLAREGCRFENYFATAAVCSPSRGCILTGRYPQTNGLMGLTHTPWLWSLKPGERHLGSLLSEAGYHTTLVGFQHVTRDDPHTLGYHDVVEAGRLAPQKASSAVEILQHQKPTDPPFFLKVGFHEVHRRFDTGGVQPDSEKGVYVPPYLADTEVTRNDLAGLQGSIKFMDAGVGEILSGLEQSGLTENTVVIFTSDHGIPYSGAKWSLFDPGLETPLIMRWPAGGLVGGTVHHQLMSNVDFLPTLLDLVGAPIPENVQGVSAAKILRGESDAPIRDAVFAEHVSQPLRDNTCRCIRTGRYKLIRYFEPGRTIVKPIDVDPQAVAEHLERPRRDGTRPVVQLFDLKEDAIEYQNLAQDPSYADLVEELSNRLWQWMEEVGDPILEGPLRTPYYEQAMGDYARYQRNQE